MKDNQKYLLLRCRAGADLAGGVLERLRRVAAAGDRDPLRFRLVGAFSDAPVAAGNLTSPSFFPFLSPPSLSVFSLSLLSLERLPPLRESFGLRESEKKHHQFNETRPDYRVTRKLKLFTSGPISWLGGLWAGLLCSNRQCPA